MGKFAVYIDGGEGCDHTSACNKRLVRLTSETMEQALVEAERYLGDPHAGRPGIGCGEGYAVKATVLELSDERDVDISAWLRQKRAAKKQWDALVIAEAEHTEYLRLKAKFNG